MIGSSGPLPEGYQFVRNLGLGGSGWVVLARQEQLDRLVAVKTLLTGTRDQAGLRRLEREGRVLVGLQNPHIVRVFALLPSRDGVALVMEYLPGGDLRSLMNSDGLAGTSLTGGPALTGGSAARLLTEVASGLEHAHQRGVVHRDIKPANILLTSPDDRGEVKIADFGLARLPRAAGAFRTSDGHSSGTPVYMAPEQITDPGLESPAIDVYAFCVLACQVLTGQLPLRGDSPAQVLQAQLHENPLHPGDLVPGFPAEVGDVLLAGLAKDPRARPSLPELAARLSAVPAAEWDALTAGRAPGRRPDPGDTSRTAGPAEGATMGATEGATVGATEGATVGASAGAAPAGGAPPMHPSSGHPPARSQRPMVMGAGPEFSAPFIVPDSVYRPPAVPLLRRRLVYLSLALGFGAVIGVVLVLGVR